MLDLANIWSQDSETHSIRNGVKSRDPLYITVADTSGSENGWGKDGDTSDTNPLLHDLKPYNELNAATGVEFA